jgi:hypothetical protein
VIVDYHMHLRNEPCEIAHDTGSVEPVRRAARARGVDEIGFTEHGYYFTQLRTLWSVPYQTERCVYDLERTSMRSCKRAIAGCRSSSARGRLRAGREDETGALLRPIPGTTCSARSTGSTARRRRRAAPR